MRSSSTRGTFREEVTWEWFCFFFCNFFPQCKALTFTILVEQKDSKKECLPISQPTTRKSCGNESSEKKPSETSPVTTQKKKKKE